MLTAADPTAARTGRDANGASPPLEVIGLHLSYGGFPALRGIDLSVAAGEFVALLGPSGCGKTSLLRAVAGFVQPQRGAIRLNGRDVAGLPPRQRNLGLVFQSYALFPHMTVLDNVCFGLECRRLPRSAAVEQARRTLALVGLGEFERRLPKQLSGGQQQRVALARAIVIEPSLLLLDEPFGALDKQLRVQMQGELKALQRRLGVTAIFVTHDQEEAMSMADRIVVMRDGVIQQIDAPERLFINPGSAWVCDFMDAGNLLRGRFERIGSGRVRLDLGGGAAFEAAVPIGADTEAVALYVPFDRIRLERVASGQGLAIAARRFLGLTVELSIACDGGRLRTQVPAARADEFPIGALVRVAADPLDCRLLPEVQVHGRAR